MSPRAPLHVHGDTPCPAVGRIEATLARDDRCLRLSYALTGDLDALRIASPGRGEFADGLWQHTCFEVFLKPEGGAAYVELNLAPSRCWAAYGFRDTRQRTTWRPTAAPVIDVGRKGRTLRLTAQVPMSMLGAVADAPLVLLGLSAVVESRDGDLSYWALRHVAGRPDFHHPDAFALRWEP
jgi:hypothetical protein